MSEYRFLRLHFMANHGNNSCGFNKIEFAEEMSGENVATSGVISSSGYTSSNTPNNALNDNPATGWLSGGYFSTSLVTGESPRFPYSNVWLAYDFLEPKAIVELRYMVSGQGSFSYNISPYTIFVAGSNDGVYWEEIKIITGLPQSMGNFNSVNIGTPSTSTTNRLVGVYTKEAENNYNQDTLVVKTNGYPSFFDANGNIYPTALTPYSGTFKISGTTTSEGVPVSRRVFLFDQKGHQIARVAITGKDGRFEFRDVLKGKYTVLGEDTSGVQNSVVFAHVESVE